MKASTSPGKLRFMFSYGQFCPVSQALEVVGERWTLLIVRELLCGDYRFNELLHGVPLMSRSLLSQRLKSLEDNGLLVKALRDDNTQVYRLTPAGRELAPIVMGLGTWGQRWARRKQEEEVLDPVLLMWDLRRNLDLERIPEHVTWVMFWFHDLDSARSRYWLRLERPEVDLCLTNPGFDVQLQVETTLRTMVDVWMGQRELSEAMARGEIRLQGNAQLTRTFPRWLLLSTFAKTPLPTPPAPLQVKRATPRARVKKLLKEG